LAKKSAGLILYRRSEGEWQVFLVHPGGPLWARRDAGAWSIPKGEFTTENGLDAAIREFLEETGFAPEGEFHALTPVVQAGRKVVHAWAFEGDCDPARLRSNTFAMEWPFGSGRIQSFPEVDRAAWFSLARAREAILRGQVPLLDELERWLEGES